MTNEEIINELNVILKGENMAIDGYDKFIENVDDPNIKRVFQEIQTQHKHHAIEIAKRIQDFGGKPEKGVDLAGKIAEIWSDIKGITTENKTKFLLVNAYNSEAKGIEMVEEYVKGDLDKKSNKLINNIINDDKSHLDTLNRLIN